MNVITGSPLNPINTLQLKIIPSDISNFSDMVDRRAPGCERRSIKPNNGMSSDYRKMTGYRGKGVYKMLPFFADRLWSTAMHSKIVPGESRVPTSQWSGTGLSNSTPDYVMRKLQQLELAAREDKEWAYDDEYFEDWSASNLFDSLSKQSLHPLEDTNWDIGTLFMQHGLNRYTGWLKRAVINIDDYYCNYSRALYRPRNWCRPIHDNERSRFSELGRWQIWTSP